MLDKLLDILPLILVAALVATGLIWIFLVVTNKVTPPEAPPKDSWNNFPW